MKKIIFILTLLSVLAIDCYSQKIKKTIFGAGAGLSLPYAEFASKSLTINSGFASAGFNTETSLIRYTGRFFGLSATIGYSNIFISERKFETEYNRVMNGNGTNQVTAGNYQIMSGMAGLIFKVPEFSNTDILLMLNLGAALTVHPDITATNSYFGVINSVKKDADFAVASNAAVKVIHWLTERYGFSAGYSLNATRPSIKDDTGINAYFYLPVRYQNINIGFIMNLGKITE